MVDLRSRKVLEKDDVVQSAGRPNTRSNALKKIESSKNPEFETDGRTTRGAAKKKRKRAGSVKETTSLPTVDEDPPQYDAATAGNALSQNTKDAATQTDSTTQNLLSSFHPDAPKDGKVMPLSILRSIEEGRRIQNDRIAELEEMLDRSRDLCDQLYMSTRAVAAERDAAMDRVEELQDANKKLRDDIDGAMDKLGKGKVEKGELENEILVLRADNDAFRKSNQKLRDRLGLFQSTISGFEDVLAEHKAKDV